MSELNDSLLDLGPPLIEWSILCVWQTVISVIYDWNVWTYCLDRRMEEERKNGLIRKVQMGKKNKTDTTCCVLHVHVLYFHTGCQVLRTVCILLFPPVQVASHGEPH